MDKRSFGNFPGGPVVKTGDTGSIPGQGTKIPHALEQLSSHTETTEVHTPETATTRESPCTTKNPHDAMKILCTTTKTSLACVPAKLLHTSDWMLHCEPKPPRLLCPWDFPGKNTGVGCYVLL